MVKARILLIDPDKVVYDSLSKYLRASGYELLYAQNGSEGLLCAAESQPDLIILDVMLQGMDGWEVCQKLHQETTVPIMLLTAKNEELDILHGFQLGVDDYVVKPFSFAVLEARIAALLSRSRRTSPDGNSLTSSDITINFERKHVIVDGKQVELTPTEYRLLETLARHANRTIPVSRLLSEVWGSDYQAEDRYVKQFVWALRQKIEDDPNEPKHLITRRGFGYRFE